jgi:hypothetical protein
MAVDKRELILARIAALLVDLPGTVSTVRNRALLDNDVRPATILLDGDEFARLTGDKRGRQRMSPQVMELRPQIFIVMDVRAVQNENIGQDMNAIRFELVRSLASDQELLDLIGTNGNIALIRAETDLKSGSAVKGQMRLDFTLTYLLDPYQV